MAICFDYKFYISQTTLPGMTKNNYENMLLPIPNVEEQRDIIEKIELSNQSIDSIIVKKQNIIQLLVDYKKALIYEVVTGKKEV